MHANVTSCEIQPDKMDEFIKIYDESVKPIVEKIPGLQNLYVLTDQGNSKAMIIALYGSQVEAENASTDGHVQAALGKLASTLMVESIARGSYAVSTKI